MNPNRIVLESASPPLRLHLAALGTPTHSYSSRERTFKIGRDIKSDIRLDFDGVSRIHSVIGLSEEGAYLIDLGSGTYHSRGGAPLASINKVHLEAGDRFSIGPVVFDVGECLESEEKPFMGSPPATPRKASPGLWAPATAGTTPGRGAAPPRPAPLPVVPPPPAPPPTVSGDLRRVFRRYLARAVRYALQVEREEGNSRG